MKRVYRAKETWTNIIAECRASSLSDAEWCRQNGIKISTFYATVKKFKKEGIAIPAKTGRGGATATDEAFNKEVHALPETGEDTGTRVGEINIVENPISRKAGIKSSSALKLENPYAMEIEVGNYKVRVNNDTDPKLVAEMIGVLTSSTN